MRHCRNTNVDVSNDGDKSGQHLPFPLITSISLTLTDLKFFSRNLNEPIDRYLTISPIYLKKNQVRKSCKYTESVFKYYPRYLEQSVRYLRVIYMYVRVFPVYGVWQTCSQVRTNFLQFSRQIGKVKFHSIVSLLTQIIFRDF